MRTTQRRVAAPVLVLVTLAVVDVISLGYRTDLMVRALEGSEIVDHFGYVSVRTPANPAFWWGNFLLLPARAAQGEAGQWLSLFTAEFPAAAHVALGLDVTDDAGADLAGFVAAGLDVRRETVLTAPALGEPPHPNRAAVLRQLAGDDDWRQSARLQALCDAEDGLPASQAFTEARNAARRGLAEAGHGAWFGAFLDGELVSQLGVFSGRTSIARYQNVGTHPGARRQGLAGTLVCHAARYAIGYLGAKTLVIVADPREPAIRVYRSVGFADRETQVSMQRPPSGS
jgi:ribosomal protein S18 acetylase RimI-like enzyme